MADERVPGVHLTRTDENVAEISALGALLGGAVGVDAVLGDLNRQGRRSWGWFGRAVHRAYTWDAEDRRTRAWWPQGITTSADASDTEEIGGRRVLAVTWYAREVAGANQGSRVTFVDLDTLRYRHVLLVVPTLRDDALQLEPLKVHAGGVVWLGPYLHVAATSRGFVTARLDDIMRIPDDRGGVALRSLGIDGDSVASYGYRYVLPVRFRYQAFADQGLTRLRYSFLSLDRRSAPPTLVAGEYGLREQSTRLARFPLDVATGLLETGADGASRPVELDERGVCGMQGAVVVDGTWHVTVSHGPWGPGTVFVGRPGALRPLRLATPMGPEDLAYWPSTDTFWSVTEHPRRRWVYAMRRSSLRAR
ncbi:MAG: hypothetical protein U0R80_08850 [Nocardioidaceae bacterium]